MEWDDSLDQHTMIGLGASKGCPLDCKKTKNNTFKGQYTPLNGPSWGYTWLSMALCLP